MERLRWRRADESWRGGLQAALFDGPAAVADGELNGSGVRTTRFCTVSWNVPPDSGTTDHRHRPQRNDPLARARTDSQLYPPSGASRSSAIRQPAAREPASGPLGGTPRPLGIPFVSGADPSANRREYVLGLPLTWAWLNRSQLGIIRSAPLPACPKCLARCSGGTRSTKVVIADRANAGETLRGHAIFTQPRRTPRPQYPN